MHGGSLLRYEEPQSYVAPSCWLVRVAGRQYLCDVSWAPEQMVAASVSPVVVTLQVAP